MCCTLLWLLQRITEHSWTCPGCNDNNPYRTRERKLAISFTCISICSPSFRATSCMQRNYETEVSVQEATRSPRKPHVNSRDVSGCMVIGRLFFPSAHRPVIHTMSIAVSESLQQHVFSLKIPGLANDNRKMVTYNWVFFKSAFFRAGVGDYPSTALTR